MLCKEGVCCVEWVDCLALAPASEGFVIGSAMRGSVHADVDAGIWDLELRYRGSWRGSALLPCIDRGLLFLALALCELGLGVVLGSCTR
jgi:hypothetical protein